jgi:hypothetical protein
MIANSLGIENACEIRFKQKQLQVMTSKIFNENDELKPMKRLGGCKPPLPPEIVRHLGKRSTFQSRLFQQI